MHRPQKPTGLSFSNPQNGLRFAMQESTEMNACWSVYKQRRYKYKSLAPP